MIDTALEVVKQRTIINEMPVVRLRRGEGQRKNHGVDKDTAIYMYSGTSLIQTPYNPDPLLTEGSVLISEVSCAFLQ